jgi:hypothetical protein
MPVMMLFAKLENCEFALQEIEFLGFIIGKDGLRVDSQKIETFKHWPMHRRLLEVQQFLGFALSASSFPM